MEKIHKNIYVFVLSCKFVLMFLCFLVNFKHGSTKTHMFPCKFLLSV